MCHDEPQNENPKPSLTVYFEKYGQLKSGKITPDEWLAYCKDVLNKFMDVQTDILNKFKSR